MKVLLTISTILIALTACTGICQDRAGPELKRLQGVWSIAACETDNANKEQFDKELVAKGKITIQNDILTVYLGDKKLGEGKIKIDPASRPKVLDVIAVDPGAS